MRSDAIVLLAASMTMGCLDDRPLALDENVDASMAVEVPLPEADPPAEAPAAECAYDEAAPARPSEPGPGWCGAVYTDAQGALLKRVERTLTQAGNFATEAVLAFDGEGTPTYAAVSSAVDGDEIFESVQHFLYPPDGTLPNTYGQPATYSVATTRDDAGRAVRVQTDVAIDGVIEREAQFVYRDGVLVESRSLSGGELQTLRTFSATGRPLTDGLGEDGQRWFYDGAGLLERIELFVGGRLVRWTDWVESAPDVPLESTTHTRAYHDDGTFTDRRLASARWTRGEGVVFEQTALISDAVGVRTTVIETDAEGREVRFVETDEGPAGQTYVRESAWRGEVLVRKRTTVDGAPLETFDATLDAAGRVLERRWVFEAEGRRSERISRWAYDRCGAVVRQSDWWNGARTHLEVSAVDDAGRITRKTVTDREGDTRITEYIWDEAGRLVEAGGTRFGFDPEGRLQSVTYGDDLRVWLPIGGQGDAHLPPTRMIEYAYDCGG